MAGRQWRRGRYEKIRGHLQAAGRSLAAFLLGLLLASLYGVTVLFMQQQPLWFCAYSTLGVALLAAFGTGLSANVRANIMLMLPLLCSVSGRNFLLFLSVSVLLAGPLSNTLDNSERVATSLLCAAELAANQTQELMQRAATPLFPVLDRIREITSNAHAVAGRVHNFINALSDNVRHVARTLRNVLHFLVDIGDVCNAKLGSPYRKCQAVFTEARTDCTELLGQFNFLCEIINGLLPLCSIAHVGQLFCILPSYIASHLKKRLAEPTAAAFEHMKQQFDFSISASVTFDLDVNSSRSLAEMSQQIMQEVSSELGSFQKWSELLSYGSLVLLAWTYLKAMWYRRRYLHQDTFDNVYITAQFEELDQQLARKDGASVLPITRKEATTYITPLSWRLAVAERQVVALSMLSVLSHMVAGAVLVFLDLLVFWMLDQIQQLVKGDIAARAPVILAVQVHGSGYASDIFKDVVAAFNILQTGNITVISKKCLVEPTEPHYTGYAVIGFLYGLALLFSVAGGFVLRSRRWICFIFHPEREEERIQFLHDHILEQRRIESRALRMTAALSRTEQAGGGGGGGSSCLRTLLLWLPGGFFLSDLLNLSVVCLFCGEAEKQGGSNMVACPIPQCTGMYCQTCFQSLENKCVLCVGPLTCEEDSQTELDSSDEEQLGAQVLNLPHISHLRGNKGRKVTKRRVTMATHHSAQTRAQISSHDGRQCRDDTDSDSSRHITLYCDSEHSEADLSGQSQQRDSASNASFHTPRDSLQAIIIHQPNCP